MIVRIFRVRAREGRVDEFRSFFTETAIPLMRRQSGLTTLIPGLPRPETPRDFSMVMVWNSVEALAAFAGDDWRQPHIDPAEAEIVEDRWLDHYDLAET
ncbi:antibiotic biosynthesis monooxygenase family protein [Pukyongiella litopenaei]|uniref:ABM domain-containing protein n=1 Tax=Pukyongiella litopenaei TaxID=2605946 RepID=A0A2S0MKP6_9RHOB|nr:hypothetical protein [Pukyongiella litopenaei]AVO36263.1 hypothetical protein C6Y53_00060 [Pukyongiella litopenaei]